MLTQIRLFICIYTVCPKMLQNISVDDKSRPSLMYWRSKGKQNVIYSLYMVKIYMKCNLVFGFKRLINHVTLILLDLPSRADEIVKPHSDMNIKVVANTVTEKLHII